MIPKIELRVLTKNVYKEFLKGETAELMIEISLIGIYKEFEFYPSFTFRDNSIHGRGFAIDGVRPMFWKMLNKIDYCRILQIDVHYFEDTSEKEKLIRQYFRNLKFLPKLTCVNLLDLNISETKLGKVIYENLNILQPVKAKIGTLWAPLDRFTPFLSEEILRQNFSCCEFLQWNIPGEIDFEKISKIETNCLLIPNMKWANFQESLSYLSHGKLLNGKREMVFCLQCLVDDQLVLDSFRIVLRTLDFPKSFVEKSGRQRLEAGSIEAEDLIETVKKLKWKNAGMFEYPYKAADFSLSRKQGFFKRSFDGGEECLYFVNQQKGIVHQTHQYLEVFVKFRKTVVEE
ncbi:unnamed protein product, partial [Mesorhabditis belari]|uniref:DUF38 domain-containing protein n=1 Tax=Mesorhabditis belari TaxID=2138241 RepID=A0AAF3FI18_9BILA